MLLIIVLCNGQNQKKSELFSILHTDPIYLFVNKYIRGTVLSVGNLGMNMIDSCPSGI